MTGLPDPHGRPERSRVDGRIHLEQAATIDIDLRALERDLRTRLADWRGLQTHNVGQARQILRRVLDGPMWTTAVGAAVPRVA